MPQFDAIIFDCDGVLVDSEALGLDASAEYLREHGFSWSPAELVRQFTGYRDDVFARKLNDAYRQVHGRDPDNSFFHGLVETRRSLRHLLEVVPGAIEAINAIAIRKAVASSSRTEILHAKMKRTGIFDLFEPHIYSADQVPEGKPAPDVFLLAAQELGIPAARCLVIEDSGNGVRAGVAAGMVVWGFTGGGHCFDGHGDRLCEAGAERIIPDFQALTSALVELSE